MAYINSTTRFSTTIKNNALIPVNTKLNNLYFIPQNYLVAVYDPNEPSKIKHLHIGQIYCRWSCIQIKTIGVDFFVNPFGIIQVAETSSINQYFILNCLRRAQCEAKITLDNNLTTQKPGECPHAKRLQFNAKKNIMKLWVMLPYTKSFLIKKLQRHISYDTW